MAEHGRRWTVWPAPTHQQSGACRSPFTFSLLVVPILLGALCVPEAVGQTGGEADPTRVLTSAHMGRPLRIFTEGATIEGTLRDVSNGSIVLATRTSDMRVSLAPTDSLWVRRRSTRNGALIGAAVGLGLTAGLCLESWDECGLEVGLGVISPLLALVGAGIGSFWSWQRLWP